jgi:hypothetical protein
MGDNPEEQCESSGRLSADATRTNCRPSRASRGGAGARILKENALCGGAACIVGA